MTEPATNVRTVEEGQVAALNAVMPLLTILLAVSVHGAAEVHVWEQVPSKTVAEEAGYWM